MESNEIRRDEARKFKISIIGDMGTGKTCLSLRFVRNHFSEDHKATISDIETKGVTIQDTDVVFQIWDTAGQERFRSLLPLYMKGIHGAVVVYDVTDKTTFEHVEQWIAEVRKYSENSTVIVVVGNKIDLVQNDRNRRQTQTEKARSWCRNRDIVFFETSAKTGENVDKMFLSLGEEMLLKSREQLNKYTYTDSSSLSVNEDGRKCC